MSTESLDRKNLTDDENFGRKLMTQHIDEAQKVLNLCSTLPSSVPGGGKLTRKIQAEIKFYKQALKKGLNEDSLAGNNLLHLSSIVNCALWVEGLQDVLKTFKTPQWMAEEYSSAEKVTVDVVADGGRTWIKVVGRNPTAVLESIRGENEFGKRHLLQQLKDLFICKHVNDHLWNQPNLKVYFASTHEVPDELTKIVEESGATVLKYSERKSHIHYSYDMINNYSASYGALRLEDIPKSSPLNLDVSTMIAYVSAMTNGRANFRFKEDILTDQARNERAHPVKPVLEKLFADRKLLCCQTAYHDFTEIISTLAGPLEKAETEKLLGKCTIVPDEISERSLTLLQREGNVKKRPITVFGVGDKLKAVTVTANAGFIRSSAAQSIFFVAFTHPSRALTENKEKTATIVEEENSQEYA